MRLGACLDLYLLSKNAGLCDQPKEVLWMVEADDNIGFAFVLPSLESPGIDRAIARRIEVQVVQSV